MWRRLSPPCGSAIGGPVGAAPSPSAALLALVIRGYGQLLLTQPWNPYLPLLAWLVVLLGTWSVLCGDSLMLVPLVVAASLCAQTHVPYLVPCAVLMIGSLLAATWQRRHWRFAGERRWLDRNVVVATALGVVLWVPPLVDQLTNHPGNVSRLLDHFGDPPEPVLGVADGLRLALRHLDVWAAFAGFTGDLEGAGRFVSPAEPWRGALALGVWLLAVLAAWRHGPPALRRLHVVIGAALILGLASMTRIFGLPWYYLTLWAWGTTTLAVGAVAWTALSWWRASARTAISTQALPLLAGRGTRRFDDRVDGGVRLGRGPRRAPESSGRSARRADLRRHRHPRRSSRLGLPGALE